MYIRMLTGSDRFPQQFVEIHYSHSHLQGFQLMRKVALISRRFVVIWRHHWVSSLAVTLPDFTN